MLLVSYKFKIIYLLQLYNIILKYYYIIILLSWSRTSDKWIAAETNYSPLLYQLSYEERYIYIYIYILLIYINLYIDYFNIYLFLNWRINF